MMADRPLNEKSVMEVLEGFQDPETGRSITQLQQVHDVKLDGDKLSLTLGMTTFSAPLWGEVQAELEQKLRDSLPGLAEVTIHMAVHERPPLPLGEIGLKAKSVIAIGSGKGGVGKSTIAACLAYSLKNAGSSVGLMDADLYGPSIPHLLGVREKPVLIEKRFQPSKVDGLKVMSMGLLVPPNQAVVWRGPMLHSAITQFLRDTEWGELDYLIIDMPPGTGDVSLSLSQLLPLTGAVVVCTPQKVALLDAVKAISMFRQVKINVLGMIENMSSFHCPDCDKRYDIFGSGGARKCAADLEIPFLGELPINIQMRINGDRGQVKNSLEDEAVAPYLKKICLNLVRNLVQSIRKEPTLPTLSVVN